MRSSFKKSLTKNTFFYVAVIERKDGNAILAFETDISADSYPEQVSMVAALHETSGVKRDDLDSSGGTHLFPCVDEMDQMSTVSNLLKAAARHGVNVSVVTTGGSARSVTARQPSIGN